MDLVRKPSVITANANKITRNSRFKKILVTRGRELVSKKNIAEVRETILATLGVTSVPEIADLLVKISSDLQLGEIVDLTDALIIGLGEIKGIAGLIGKFLLSSHTVYRMVRSRTKSFTNEKFYRINRH